MKENEKERRKERNTERKKERKVVLVAKNKYLYIYISLKQDVNAEFSSSNRRFGENPIDNVWLKTNNKTRCEKRPRSVRQIPM